MDDAWRQRCGVTNVWRGGDCVALRVAELMDDGRDRGGAASLRRCGVMSVWHGESCVALRVAEWMGDGQHVGGAARPAEVRR